MGPVKNKGTAMTQQLCYLESAQENHFHMDVHKDGHSWLFFAPLSR